MELTFLLLLPLEFPEAAYMHVQNNPRSKLKQQMQSVGPYQELIVRNHCPPRQNVEKTQELQNIKLHNTECCWLLLPSCPDSSW